MIKLLSSVNESGPAVSRLLWTGVVAVGAQLGQISYICFTKGGKVGYRSDKKI